MKPPAVTPKRGHLAMAMFVCCTELSTLLSIESLMLHMGLALLLFGKDVAEVFILPEDEIRRLV